MEREQTMPAGEDATAPPSRTYLALSGTVDAKPGFVGKLLTANWIRRVLYNAAIDPHVAFAEGVEYRLALSAAQREKRDPPLEPVKSETFLPIPNPFELGQVLTQLRERHPELRTWPVSMLRIAVAEACTARARHVKACVEAKQAGGKLPRLHFRSARDDVDVSTEAVRISRCGDGPAVTKPKRQRSAKAEAQRRRKERAVARKDAEWAKRRREAGMWEPRVLAGLREWAERRERDRKAQAARQETYLARARERNAPRPRRDSPSATIGESRAKLTIQGLGTVRVRLSRPIPEGAEVVRVHLVKLTGEGHRVEARLVLDVPAVARAYDEIATGAAIHAVVRALPQNASPLTAVEAVEAAGIKVRGDDWNVSAPSADHTGQTTRPVRISKAELKRLARDQRKLSHKDAILLGKARKAEPGPEAKEAPEAPRTRKPRPKRSRSANKLVAAIKRTGRKLANRATTRACQDAKRLLEGVALVATDPQRMAAGLLAKGGPAERRVRAALPEAAPTEARAPRGFRLTPAQQRTMRRNMHMARPGYRVRRLNLLCTAAGVIHATPGHAYTSQTCPRCVAVEPKALSQRVHACRHCGLVMPRDQASALVTLGRALLAYREGPDPGGLVAERRAKAAETARKAEALRERRAAGGRKTGAARKERAKSRVAQAGVVPAGGAPAPSLQGVVPLCPGPSGRNIGGNPVAAGAGISN